MQSFTARVPLLTATSAFRLGRIRWSSPQQRFSYLCCRTSQRRLRGMLAQVTWIVTVEIAVVLEHLILWWYYVTRGHYRQ